MVLCSVAEALSTVHSRYQFSKKLRPICPPHWSKSRIKLDMSIQTAVILNKIRYHILKRSESHLKTYLSHSDWQETIWVAWGEKKRFWMICLQYDCSQCCSGLTVMTNIIFFLFSVFPQDPVGNKKHRKQLIL